MELFEDSNSYVNALRRRKLNKLWDVEELYEVDVYRENNDVLDMDFDKILNTAGIHCHICNLEVPKMYIKEHNQTSTHQNLLKLTDEALERTRNHIKNTETSYLTIKVENTYFCDICSKIVENSEKELHEKSNYHKKCVNFNNLLSCFVDSYLNVNEKTYDLNCNLENNMQNDTAEYVILLSEMQQKELFENLEPQEIQELLKTENQELENTDSKIELIKKQTQELNQKQESNQELSKSPKKSKSEKFQYYFETIKSKNCNKNFEIEYIPKNQVKITALNKDVIIVQMQHFHSYNNNNKFCRVCLSEILEENHKNSEDHISHIMTPVADKNGIRWVDDIWSHCIICNELTKTVVSHNQSLNHLKNLIKCHLIRFSRSQKNETGKVQIETDEVQKQSEDPINPESKTDLAPVRDFFKTIDSKLDSIFAISKKVLNMENNSDESDDFQIVGCKNKPNTYENVAGNSNTSNDQNYKSDIQSFKSEVNESEIIQDSIQNDNSNVELKLSHYCSVCRINVADYFTHKLLQRHKQIAKENQKEIRQLRKNNYLLPVKNQNLVTKCGLCDINVQKDRRLIEVHINTDVHRTNYLKFMEDNKIKLINDQQCHCEPCDQELLRKQVFKHCSKLQHELKNGTNNDEISKLVKFNFKTINAQDLFCKTCYVSIPNIDVAIKKHVDSAEHYMKYNGIMTMNKVKINKNSLYCEICSLEIPLGGEFDHIYSNSHRESLMMSAKTRLIDQKNTESIPSTSNTEVVEFATKTQPKNAEPKKINMIEVPLYVVLEVDDQTCLCRTCCVRIPKIDSALKQHVDSRDHCIKYNDFMTRNKIKIDEDSFYCEICCANMPMGWEFNHIYSNSHRESLIMRSKIKLIDQINTETIPGTSKTEIVESVPKTTEREKIEEIIVPLFIKPHFKKANETNANCIICEKLVPHSDIRTHAESYEHYIKFDALMCKNGIKINQGKTIHLYSCLTCENSVPKFGEIGHVFGKHHVKKFEDKTSSALAKQAAESDLEYLTFAFISTLPGGDKQVLLFAKN